VTKIIATMEAYEMAVTRGFSHCDMSVFWYKQGSSWQAYTKDVVEEGVVVGQWLSSGSWLIWNLARVGDIAELVGGLVHLDSSILGHWS